MTSFYNISIRHTYSYLEDGSRSIYAPTGTYFEASSTFKNARQPINISQGRKRHRDLLQLEGTGRIASIYIACRHPYRYHDYTLGLRRTGYDLGKDDCNGRGAFTGQVAS